MFVRSSPLVPLILIMLGVLLGRLVRWVDSPVVKGRMATYDAVLNLRADAQELNDPSAQEYIRRRIDDLERASRKPGDEAKVAEWKATADEIAQRLQTFRKLDNLQAVLTKPPYAGKPEVPPIGDQLNEAREKLLLDGQPAFDAALSIVTDIETKLAQPSFRGRGLEEKSLLSALDVRLTDTPVEEVARSPQQEPGDRVANALRWISGISTGATYFVVRPLLWFVLIAVLGLTGLQSQYVSGGATFGAGGIYDYLALFLWGLTADVASTGLLNLSQLTANRGA